MISAVVLSKNEEKNLEKCLGSIKWCNEVIVIDDLSCDRTVEIAKRFTQKVFIRPLNNDFASQRNFGLEKATGDWILFVDADEEITEKLKEEIISKLKNTQKAGFYFKRRDYILGRWLKYGETSSVRLLRLAKKDQGTWERKVDEKWVVGDMGKVGELREPILHYSHSELKGFFESINNYSTLNAESFYLERKINSFLDWFKPLGKFLQNYFFHLGFLDGTQGFIFATLMSFHSYLVRGKLYLLWKRGGGWH